jgi:hypothetical protein
MCRSHAPRESRAPSDAPEAPDASGASGATGVEVSNLHPARFECVYPTCGGLCCMNGRPAIEPDEEARIRSNADKFVDRLLPAARERIARHGFLTPARDGGRPTLSVSRGWCVFFHDGCVLQKVGAEEGDPLRYKPWRCALFPLRRDPKSGEWFVRQRGERGEKWDLFCLNPDESEKRAAETLQVERAHLQRRIDEGRLPAPLAAPPGERSRPA